MLKHNDAKKSVDIDASKGFTSLFVTNKFDESEDFKISDKYSIVSSTPSLPLANLSPSYMACPLPPRTKIYLDSPHTLNFKYFCECAPWKWKDDKKSTIKM